MNPMTGMSQLFCHFANSTRHSIAIPSEASSPFSGPKLKNLMFLLNNYFRTSEKPCKNQWSQPVNYKIHMGKWKSTCTMCGKGCLSHDSLSASRQDIIEKLGHNLEKNIVKHSCHKTWVATSLCKMKIDMPKVTQGVAVAKYRWRNCTEHLEKTKDQSVPAIVKTVMNQNSGSI